MREYLIGLHEMFKCYLIEVKGISERTLGIAANGLRGIQLSDEGSLLGAIAEIRIYIKFRGEFQTWKIGICEDGEICGDVGTLKNKEYRNLCGLCLSVLSMACERYTPVKSVLYDNTNKTLVIKGENGEEKILPTGM